MGLEFLIVVLLIELSPGPNMLVLAAIAAREGRRAGFAAVAGVTLGLSVYLGIAVLGLGAVLAQTPGVLHALRWAGIAYLVWLAWEAWAPGAENSPGKAAISEREHFTRGLIANLLNAKAAIFYVVLLPRFIDDAAAPVWQQALLLGGVHLGVATAIHAAIVLGAGAAQPFLARATSAKGVRALFALGLLASAAWLAIEGLRG